MLHAQVGQIAVYTFHRVGFERAGQMLPAGVGVARQLRNIQLGVCVVRLQVGNRLGNQQACGGGRRRGAAGAASARVVLPQSGHFSREPS